jgi:hypothetical protein
MVACMNRRERIVTLLEHYADVVEGLRDRGDGQPDACSVPCKDWERLCSHFGCAQADGGVLAMMNRAWNHPSYRELERLRVALRHQEPSLYWHLAQTYFFAPVQVRLVCPHCWDTLRKRGESWPAHSSQLTHHHPSKGRIPLVPRSVRRVSQAVEPESVEEAIEWLDDRWVGDVFVPDDVLSVMRREEVAA